jgi:hypothetical protein
LAKPRDRAAGAIKRAQVDGSELAAARAGEAQPRNAGRDRSADRRVEPERTPAGLARLPDSDDPLSLSDRLALGLLALRFGPCSIAFLRAAVRAPGKGYRSKRNRQ